ncbi:MAG TPA: hypothetical protein VNS63_02110 [Blastocatellia bacterium]|nr:hypothetical protein [Blastocatellia bacterium]
MRLIEGHFWVLAWIRRPGDAGPEVRVSLLEGIPRKDQGLARVCYQGLGNIKPCLRVRHLQWSDRRNTERQHD